MSRILCPIRERALKEPQKIAIFTDEKTYSYLDLEKKISEIQSRIHEKPGTKVLLQSPSKFELICQIFACLRKELSICILDPKLPDALISLTSQKLQANPLRLKDRISSLPSGKELNLHYPAIFLKTSGTTSDPKLAAITLRAITEHAQNRILLDPEDRWNVSLPLHHISGLIILFRAFMQKAALILSHDPFAHEPTHLSFVPTQLQRAIKKEFPQSLKKILLGGSSVSCELLAQANEKNLPLAITYSMTENCSTILYCENPVIYQNKIYLGFPSLPQKMKLSANQEIFIQGPTLFSGYWKNNQVDKKLIDGWFSTKDLGICHPQFGYTITGRKDRQFISGGENIHPEEIERTLKNHPKIREAYVLPKEDIEFGNIPIAIIDGEIDFDIKSYLSQHLPHFKHPKYFILEPELPPKASRDTLRIIVKNFFLKKTNDR